MWRSCFILILLLSQALLAQESCFSKLNSQQKSFDHLQVYQNNRIKIEKILPGKRGGKLLVIRRWDSNERWNLPKIEGFENAPPGNPLWFLRAMPRRITEFFQYKALDANFKQLTAEDDASIEYIVVPDIYEINGALKALDQKLKKAGFAGIPFRFYLDEEISSNESFLRNYSEEKAFPYSMNGSISYHDLNYHFMPMLIFNEAVVERSLRVSDVFLKFGEWLRQNHPEAATPAAISTIYGIRATNLDMSGNISLYLAKKDDPNHRARAVRAYKSFAGWGYSPAQYLREVMEIKLGDSKNLTLPNVSIEMVNEFIETLDEKDKRDDLEMRALFKGENQVPLLMKRRLFEIEMALVRAQNRASQVPE